MTPVFFCCIFLSCFLGLCAALSFTRASSPFASRVRLDAVLKVTAMRPASEQKKEVLDRLIARTAFWLRSHLGLSERGGLGDRIAQAGFQGTIPIDLYTAARIVGPFTMLLLTAMLPYGRLFLVVALPAVSYLFPDWVLSFLIARRRKAIRKAMPDMLDLLVICVDAGLGLDQAMLRVAEELEMSSPQMHGELMLINREQRAGKPRLDAWTALLDRVKIPEMEAFVNMLIQTERFGTPIARALSQFAQNVRLQRTQKAEENAAKTTIKIIFPLVLFIFPSIFVVLLGPAAISILRGVKHGL